MKAIAGRHPFNAGRIAVDRQDLGHPSAVQAARAGIAYVPQGREVFPLMTVAENLQTGFACLGRGERSVPDRIYDLFPVLAQMRNRRGGDLSGGQQQHLAIARAGNPAARASSGRAHRGHPAVDHQGDRARDLDPAGRGPDRDRPDGAVFQFSLGLADRVAVLTGGQVSYTAEKGGIERASLLEAVSL